MEQKKKLNKEDILAFCTVFAVLAAGCFVSWVINCGLIFLVCMWFGLTFNLNTITTIWLLVCLASYIFRQAKDVLR